MATLNLMQGILDQTGLGGFRSGLSDFDSMLHSRQDLTDKETINKIREQQYREEELNSPVKAAKRAFELAKTESDTTDILSGGYDRQRQIDRETKQAELIAKMDENQRKKVEDVANASVRAASLFSPEDSELERQSKYAAAVEIMHQAGATGMPKEYRYENWQQLMARAKAAPNTIAHIQQRGINDQQSGLRRQEALEKYGYDVGLHSMDNVARAAEGEANRKSHEAIAGAQNTTTLEAARIRADASGGGGALTMTKADAESVARVKEALSEGRAPTDADALIFYNKYLRLEVEKRRATLEAQAAIQKQMIEFDDTLTDKQKEAKKAKLNATIAKTIREDIMENIPGAKQFFTLYEKKDGSATPSTSTPPKYPVGTIKQDTKGNWGRMTDKGTWEDITADVKSGKIKP